LSDPACNMHLVMRIYDAILLCVFPELAADSGSYTNPAQDLQASFYSDGGKSPSIPSTPDLVR